MGGGHRGIRWTANEDRQLRELTTANASDTLISAKLKRSTEAIRMRRLALQKKSNEPNDLLAPTPELPDDTPINRVKLPSRILKALLTEGIKTIGELRETADETLLTFQDLRKGSVAHLRERLGLSSIGGEGPTRKGPA